MRSPENAWKPQMWPVSLSQNSAKIRKSTNYNHNLINSEGAQDTSACKISGHYLKGFSRKCPETPNLTHFTKLKNLLKLEKSTDCDHRLINSEGATDHDHNLISSEGAQDTSTCKISDHSLHVFSGKCLETSPDGRTDKTDGWTDGRMEEHAAKWSQLVGWTNGPMYRWKEVISGFGRTDGRTDGWTTRKHNASSA